MSLHALNLLISVSRFFLQSFVPRGRLARRGRGPEVLRVAGRSFHTQERRSHATRRTRAHQRIAQQTF